MSVREQAQVYVEKWLNQEPSMRWAMVFCPSAMRERALLWGALQAELRDALFELSEPQVSRAKRDWWAEELTALGNGAARHPLTRSLAGFGGQWHLLAAELGAASQTRLASDFEQSVDMLGTLASALGCAERALLDESGDADSVRSDSQSWIAQLLVQRIPHGLTQYDKALIPLDFHLRFASAGHSALLRAWGQQVSVLVTADATYSSVFRSITAGLLRYQLARLAERGQLPEMGRWSSLIRCWGSARTYMRQQGTQ